MMIRPHVSTPVYVGIDPGATGAVAYLQDSTPARVADLPVVEIDRNGKRRRFADPGGFVALFECLALRPSVSVWCEDVWPTPGQAVTSADSMSYARGVLHTAAAIAGIEVHYVAPRQWKRRFGLLGVDRKAAKEMALHAARKRWPALAEELRRAGDADRAEALLIAQYGREVAECP